MKFTSTTLLALVATASANTCLVGFFNHSKGYGYCVVQDGPVAGEQALVHIQDFVNEDDAFRVVAKTCLTGIAVYGEKGLSLKNIKLC